MMKRITGPGRALLGRSGTAALAAVICLPAILGCRGDSVSAGAWDGAVRDSAGIQIVENFGIPLWTEGERWEFTEVLRIGAVRGEPEYEFGRITGLAVLSDRRVVVADAMSHNLRFFSADGVYQRTVGKEGKGPGEFGDRGLELLQGSGDTLLVHDVANARVNTIAPDGTWLGSFPTRAGDNYSDWDDNVAEGRLASKYLALELPDTLADALDIVLSRDVHGAVLDTVALIPTSHEFAREGALRFYYRGRPDFDLCGEGLLTGRSDEYRILWYGRDGMVDRVFSLAWEPLPMSDEDRTIIRQRWDEVLQQYRDSPERKAALMSSLRFESTYPAYRRFMCGPAATVLVQHMRPVRDLLPEERAKLPIGARWLPGTPEWDVFDSEGRYLGVAALPGTDWVAGWRNPRFVRDSATATWYMYSVWSDEQDVEYVCVWRIDGDVPD